MTPTYCQPYASDYYVRAAAELRRHTWDPVVLAALRLGPIRRNDLLRRIAGVSDKVMTESLRRLSSKGLLTTTSNDPPSTVCYQLTELGSSFANGPLRQLAEWAADNEAEIFKTLSIS